MRQVTFLCLIGINLFHRGADSSKCSEAAGTMTVGTMCHDTVASGYQVVLDVYGASDATDKSCNCMVHMMSGTKLSVNALGSMVPGFSSCGTSIKLITKVEIIGLNCQFPFGTVATENGETVEVTFNKLHLPYNSNYCLRLTAEVNGNMTLTCNGKEASTTSTAIQESTTESPSNTQQTTTTFPATSTMPSDTVLPVTSSTQQKTTTLPATSTMPSDTVLPVTSSTQQTTLPSTLPGTSTLPSETTIGGDNDVTSISPTRTEQLTNIQTTLALHSTATETTESQQASNLVQSTPVQSDTSTSTTSDQSAESSVINTSTTKTTTSPPRQTTLGTTLTDHVAVISTSTLLTGKTEPSTQMTDIATTVDSTVTPTIQTSTTAIQYTTMGLLTSSIASTLVSTIELPNTTASQTTSTLESRLTIDPTKMTTLPDTSESTTLADTSESTTLADTSERTTLADTSERTTLADTSESTPTETPEITSKVTSVESTTTKVSLTSLTSKDTPTSEATPTSEDAPTSEATPTYISMISISNTPVVTSTVSELFTSPSETPLPDLTTMVPPLSTPTTDQPKKRTGKESIPVQIVVPIICAGFVVFILIIVIVCVRKKHSAGSYATISSEQLRTSKTNHQPPGAINGCNNRDYANLYMDVTNPIYTEETVETPITTSITHPIYSLEEEETPNKNTPITTGDENKQDNIAAQGNGNLPDDFRAEETDQHTLLNKDATQHNTEREGITNMYVNSKDVEQEDKVF